MNVQIGSLRTSQRDDRIDLLRGYALIAIFVDHVPRSVFTLASPFSFAFSDAAELFFFLSGFVAARVYLPILRKHGIGIATVRVWRRAWTLYCTQILLFMALLGEVSLIVTMTGRNSYFDMFRVSHFFQETTSAIIPALSLHYQPAYLDILPVYVLLFAALPLALLALSRSAWFLLIPSFFLYGAIQLGVWSPRTYPWDAPWMFNPLAWQFLFFTGVASGSRPTGWTLLKNKFVLVGAGLFVVSAAIFQESGAIHILFPAIPSFHTFALPIGKSDLNWMRLASFAALAIVAVRLLRVGSEWQRFALWRYVSSCGRNSLPIFCLGVLLAAVGGATWVESGGSLFVQAAFSAAGIGCLVGFARLLDWVRTLEQAPTRAVIS